MSRENVDLVKSIYDAVNRRNFDAVLERLDDRLEWIEPGPPGMPTMVFTKERVATELFPVFTLFMPDIQMVMDGFFDAGDDVIATGRFVGHDAQGAEHAIAVANFWRVGDGRVVRMQSYVDTAAFLLATGWTLQPPATFPGFASR
ncbi:MAG: nuclear transport factor 2 family protein [Candidatus Binatia bacterium]